MKNLGCVGIFNFFLLLFLNKGYGLLMNAVCDASFFLFNLGKKAEEGGKGKGSAQVVLETISIIRSLTLHSPFIKGEEEYQASQG